MITEGMLTTSIRSSLLATDWMVCKGGKDLKSTGLDLACNMVVSVAGSEAEVRRLWKSIASKVLPVYALELERVAGTEGTEAEVEEGGSTGVILTVVMLGEILGVEGMREMRSEEDGEVIVIVRVEEGGTKTQVFRKSVRLGRSSSLSSSDTGFLFCRLFHFALCNSFIFHTSALCFSVLAINLWKRSSSGSISVVEGGKGAGSDNGDKGPSFALGS